MNPKMIARWLAVLLVLTWVGLTLAQGPGPGPLGCCKEGPEWGMGLHKIPDLTEEQKTKIQELRLAFQQEMLPLRGKLQALEMELKALVIDKAPDLNKINAKIDEIGKLRTELQKKAIAHRMKVRELLTDKQKLYFDTCPERYGHGFGFKKFRGRP